MNSPLPQRKSKGPKASRLMAIDSWIDSTLYDAGFKYFDLGYAAAIGVALFALTLVVALIQRAIS
jgi:ABC-type sugar transport system permease subunit